MCGRHRCLPACLPPTLPTTLPCLPHPTHALLPVRWTPYRSYRIRSSRCARLFCRFYPAHSDHYTTLIILLFYGVVTCIYALCIRLRGGTLCVRLWLLAFVRVRVACWRLRGTLLTAFTMVAFIPSMPYRLLHTLFLMVGSWLLPCVCVGCCAARVFVRALLVSALRLYLVGVGL